MIIYYENVLADRIIDYEADTDKLYEWLNNDGRKTLKDILEGGGNPD